MSGHNWCGERIVLSRRSVVICDDKPEIRDSIRRVLLKQPDLNVVGEAADLTTCAVSVRDHQPDLLILDVNIPGGGVAAARLVRTMCPDTVILAYSGRHEAHIDNEMRAAGATEFVLKTGRVLPLLEAIDRLLPPAEHTVDAY